MAYIDTSLKLDDLPVGQSRCLELGELQIGLFRNNEGLFAIDNICPHRGAPLHDGFVGDGQVTCPWHQWQFQLSDGVCRNIPNIRIPTFAVEVRDGAIWIDTDPAREKKS
jgi:NAD(P)H-dependent nitrite reductase small subunit